MNLWQAVRINSQGELCVRFIQGEGELARGEWAVVGDPLCAFGLVYPLVFEVPQRELSHALAPIVQDRLVADFIQEPWLLQFSLYKDSGDKSPLFSSFAPDVQVLSLLAEYVGCIAEVLVQMGFDFVSFQWNRNTGVYELALRVLSVSCLGQLGGNIVLLRAALELMGYARGMQAMGFHILFPDGESGTIDHTFYDLLSRKLKGGAHAGYPCP